MKFSNTLAALLLISHASALAHPQPIPDDLVLERDQFDERSYEEFIDEEAKELYKRKGGGGGGGKGGGSSSGGSSSGGSSSGGSSSSGSSSSGGARGGGTSYVSSPGRSGGVGGSTCGSSTGGSSSGDSPNGGSPFGSSPFGGSSTGGRGSNSNSGQNTNSKTSSGRGSSSSNAGGATRTGSGAGRNFGGGRYYGGGASTPYTAGGRSPGAGILPLAVGVGVGGAVVGAVALSHYPGYWPYGFYGYPYAHPYGFYNRTGRRNRTASSTSSSATATPTVAGRSFQLIERQDDQGVQEEKPVTCLCAAYAVCGCDDPGNSTFLDSLIGDGDYSKLNQSVVTVADINGSSTIVLNGTLPNGTTASGGTEDATTSAGSSLAGLFSNSGYLVMVGLVGAAVFVI